MKPPEALKCSGKGSRNTSNFRRKSSRIVCQKTRTSTNVMWPKMTCSGQDLEFGFRLDDFGFRIWSEDLAFRVVLCGRAKLSSRDRPQKKKGI